MELNSIKQAGRRSLIRRFSERGKVDGGCNRRYGRGDREPS